MVDRYELIKDLEQDPRFYELLKKGMLSLSILDRKVYYERYLHELKTNRKSQAITNAAEEYNISERSVYNAIKFMTE